MGNRSRREVLRVLGASLAAAPLASLAGCSDAPTTPTSSSGSSGGTSACVVTATEPIGPYPDKIGMLGNFGFFRQDVREGRPGVPLTLQLTIVNTNAACSAIADAAVEIWQADAEGHYSEYSQPGFDGTGQTFLRGLQSSNASGQVTFLTIYPGWEVGRATHIHVEVFVHNQSVKVTQVAFPENVTRDVYSTPPYSSRGPNPIANAADPIFADGTSTQLATLTGSVSNGYTATLRIGIAV
jgi:intradiol ring-cleaving dioxygenase-like protein